MSTWCRHVQVRPHCFILTEVCSCRLELAYFAWKISKNRLVCKYTVALAYYGSFRLLVMGSCRRGKMICIISFYRRSLASYKAWKTGLRSLGTAKEGEIQVATLIIPMLRPTGILPCNKFSHCCPLWRKLKKNVRSVREPMMEPKEISIKKTMNKNL